MAKEKSATETKPDVKTQVAHLLRSFTAMPEAIIQSTVESGDEMELQKLAECEDGRDVRRVLDELADTKRTKAAEKKEREPKRPPK